MYHTEDGSREYIGKVIDNFDCCNYSFDIKNNENKTVFYIEASCCQCGLLTRCPCKGCEKVKFSLWRGNKQQKIGGPLIKYGKRGCVKNMLTDADNFSVPFPGGTSFTERCLLLAVALFIDYRMFEDSPGGKSKKGPSTMR